LIGQQKNERKMRFDWRPEVDDRNTIFGDFDQFLQKKFGNFIKNQRCDYFCARIKYFELKNSNFCQKILKS
jgi:hypothetical protein